MVTDHGKGFYGLRLGCLRTTVVALRTTRVVYTDHGGGIEEGVGSRKVQKAGLKG